MAPGSVPSARGVAGSGTHAPGCSASGPSPEPTPGLAMSRHRQASRARPDGGYRPPGEPVLLCLPRPPSSRPRRPRALRHYCGRGQAAPSSAPTPWTWAATGPQRGAPQGRPDAQQPTTLRRHTCGLSACPRPPAVDCGPPGQDEGGVQARTPARGPQSARVWAWPGASHCASCRPRARRTYGVLADTACPPHRHPRTCSGQHLHHRPTAVPHPRPPVPTHGAASDTREGRRPARARARRAGPEPSPERAAAPRRGDPGAGAGGAAPRHAQHAVRGRCSFTWPPPPAPPAPGGPQTCAPDLRVGPCAPRLRDPAPQCPMPGPLHTAALPLADSFLVLMILAAYSWPVQSLTQRRTTEKAPLGVTWGTETEREPISVPADTQHPAMRPSPGQRDPRREGPPQTPRCPHSPPARQACPSSAGRAPAPGGPLGSAGSRASRHPWCSVPSSGDPQVPPHGHSLVGPLGTH